MEFELEKIDSDYGHNLSICLSDGRLQLTADRAIYSWEDKYDNFFKAFAQMDFSKFADKEALILGFGLGSIPQMLEQKFKKDFYYTGIEIDEQVIYLAEKYITGSLKSSIQIIQASAEIFVEITEERFDFICVDVFINDRIPAPIKQYHFIEMLAERLTEQGVLLFNHLANKESEQKEGNRFYENVFLEIFPNAALLDVDGNYIFVSNKDFLKVESV